MSQVRVYAYVCLHTSKSCSKRPQSTHLAVPWSRKSRVLPFVRRKSDPRQQESARVEPPIFPIPPRLGRTGWRRADSGRLEEPPGSERRGLVFAARAPTPQVGRPSEASATELARALRPMKAKRACKDDRGTPSQR